MALKLWQPLALVALALGLAACGSSRAAGPNAAAALRNFDVTRTHLEGSFARLNDAVRASPSQARAAGLASLRSSDGSRRFAAVYAFAATATTADRALLASLLHASTETERLLAAAGLARLHDKRALVPLIAALRSRRTLAYWAPPLPAWRFARLVLLERTGVDLGLHGATTAKAAVKAKAVWAHWWSTHHQSYTFPRNPSSP